MSSFSNLETPYVAGTDAHEANPANNALPANTPNDTNPPPAKTYANPKWAYKKGLTPYERVSHVYDVLRYQHGWSIPDFLDALVAAEPPPGKSGIQRVQAFQKALQQESIIKLLPVIERDPATQRREYINTIRSEITDLREQYAIFGKYKPSTPVNEIGLSEMSMAVQRTAPELHQTNKDVGKLPSFDCFKPLVCNGFSIKETGSSSYPLNILRLLNDSLLKWKDNKRD